MVLPKIFICGFTYNNNLAVLPTELLMQARQARQDKINNALKAVPIIERTNPAVAIPEGLPYAAIDL